MESAKYANIVNVLANDDKSVLKAIQLDVLRMPSPVLVINFGRGPS